MTEPKLIVLHRLPGRIRLRIDPAAPDWTLLEKDFRGHPGIEEYRADPRTRTVLVRYLRTEIAEAEVVVRIALSLAVSRDLAPVRIEREIEAGEMSREATLSGIALMILGSLRFLPSLRSRTSLLDGLAAAVTGGSVLAHAAREVRDEGTFHPETLSVVYLLVALAQGRGFTASLLSWLASYGRHFRGRFVEELVVRAEPTGPGQGRRRHYNMTLEPGTLRLARDSAARTIPALIAHAIAGGKPGDESLLRDIRTVSDEHGNMLEGLEGMSRGLSMQIRNG